MKEAYCSFEVSKLLKEKGFDELCYKFYTHDTKEVYREDIPCCNSRSDDYASPTHQMAIAWLREKHFIIVVTPVLFNVNYEDFKWGYDIWADDNLEVSSEDCSNPLKSYEEATESALKYVLENLI